MTGSWFAATLEELRPGFCLIAYLELKESDDEDALPLREWHPLPKGATPANFKKLASHSKHPAYMEAAYAVRPQPPAQVRAYTALQFVLRSLVNR